MMPLDVDLLPTMFREPIQHSPLKLLGSSRKRQCHDEVYKLPILGEMAREVGLRARLVVCVRNNPQF
jgi:hypothetical protein